jgi:hypothetical protein
MQVHLQNIQTAARKRNESNKTTPRKILGKAW